MSWHPIKKDAWETTEIIAFRRRLTVRRVQQEAGARSGSANTTPAEKNKKLLTIFMRLPNGWKWDAQTTRQNPEQSLGY